MGIEFRLNTEIGKDVTIDELLAEMMQYSWVWELIPT